MTNGEYLRKRLEGIGVTQNDIEILLLKAGLDENDPADAAECDKAIFYNQSIVRKACIEKTREGGFSMERNAKEIDTFLWTLATENKLLTPWQRVLG